MKIISILVCFSALACTTIEHATTNSPLSSEAKGYRERLLDNFPSISEKENLFSVDDVYALQAFYGAAHELIRIDIVPRYFFSESYPEWEEPEDPVFMNDSRFRGTLERITSIRPLGDLIQRARVGITTNLRTAFRDEYENAFIVRHAFDMNEGGEADVAWFTVLYLHSVSGMLESKEVLDIMSVDSEYILRLDGEWFWTPKGVFDEVAEGKEVTVIVAGPLEGTR